MIGALLDTLGLRSPATVRAAADLRPGKAVVFGVVHGETMPSPVHGKPCVAFYYRASFRRASRVKGFAQALLRDALVYADGLTLTVDGVSIALEPKRNMSFGREAHMALVAQKIDGFRALEKRVPDGGQVAVAGTLRKKGDAWSMVFEQMDHQGTEKAKSPKKR